MKTLCIYHGNCADGFAAAWVVKEYYSMIDKEIEFFPGVYQNSPPDVTGRDVIIVDFSYKRAVMVNLVMQAHSVTVLDHHKTAIEDLAGLEKNLNAVFDMNRSGAGITWDHFFAGKPRPKLLDHIEDRDLWKFNLPFTREIQAAVFSYPYDFEVWDELMASPPERLITEGTAIERKHFKDIHELLGVMQRFITIDGQSVPAASLPYTLTSDAGHIMSKGNGTDDKPQHPYAACYWDTPEGRVFSLRSAAGGADVSAVAKRFGGGGHAHAAGFRVPNDHPLAQSS